MIITPPLPSSSAISCLQGSFVPAKCCHPVQIAVTDLMFQCGHDFVFPGKKIRSGEVDAGDRMMGDEGAVNGQVFHKELQEDKNASMQ